MVTYKSYMYISHFDRPSLSDLPDLGGLQIATMPPWRPKHRFRQPGARGAQSARQISIIGWSWMVPSHCLGTAYGICMFGMLVMDCDHDLKFEPLNIRKIWKTWARAMLCHGHPWSFNTVPAKTTWLSLGARGKRMEKVTQMDRIRLKWAIPNIPRMRLLYSIQWILKVGAAELVTSIN